jgi:hypothetical protein
VCLVESDEVEEELGKKRDSRDVGARVISVASRPRFGCLGSLRLPNMAIMYLVTRYIWVR